MKITEERQSERESEQLKANLSIASWERDPNKKDEYPSRQPDRVGRETLKEKQDFHKEARTDGTISADYRCVTMNVSPMVGKGGVVVDVGGNSGRYAEFLAKSRSDVKVIAVEPDPEKFALAQKELEKMKQTDPSVANRIQLVNKPVAEALDALGKSGQRVDMITSLYRTHLHSDKENLADFDAIGKLAKSSGASVVTLDLHRARRHETANLMPKVFPADDASAEFREGYGQALKYGAYRGAEMEGLLNATVGIKGWEHHVAGTVGQLQMHIKPGKNDADGNAPDAKYPPTSPEYVKIAKDMNMIMRVGENVNIVADSIYVIDSVLGDVSNKLKQIKELTEDLTSDKRPESSKLGMSPEATIKMGL
ncbi:MAG: hypothetical protein RBR86_04240 [Pseudobdellovibrionaceae bacterium]|jgi:FkbM family methyltransferase|nr:hypothetical protein [Pseudobdellovibrionaceae bacterium]